MTLVLLWGTLVYAAIWVTGILLVRALLLVVGVGVTAHVLSLRTLTPEMLSGKHKTGEVERSNRNDEV